MGTETTKTTALATASSALKRHAEAREAAAAREQVVRNLQWSGKLTKTEKAVLYLATPAYGLDPALREVLVLGGNMYMTAAAMVRIAERSGTYAGVALEEMPPLEEGERRYRATVRKVIATTVAGPVFGEFQGIGRASENNVASKIVREQWLDEMAQKRAISRAIRNAYPINVPAIDEMNLDMTQAITVTQELLDAPGEPDPEDPGEPPPEQPAPRQREVGEEG
jgi:hypothetical protein